MNADRGQHGRGPTAGIPAGVRRRARPGDTGRPRSNDGRAGHGRPHPVRRARLRRRRHRGDRPPDHRRGAGRRAHRPDGHAARRDAAVPGGVLGVTAPSPSVSWPAPSAATPPRACCTWTATPTWPRPTPPRAGCSMPWASPTCSAWPIPELARLGAAVPMLTDERIALIGYDESDPETFAAGILRERPVRRRRGRLAGSAPGQLPPLRHRSSPPGRGPGVAGPPRGPHAGRHHPHRGQPQSRSRRPPARPRRRRRRRRDR
jgi:hypothetical protein